MNKVVALNGKNSFGNNEMRLYECLPKMVEQKILLFNQPKIKWIATEREREKVKNWEWNTYFVHNDRVSVKCEPSPCAFYMQCIIYLHIHFKINTYGRGKIATTIIMTYII